MLLMGSEYEAFNSSEYALSSILIWNLLPHSPSWIVGAPSREFQES